MAAVPPLPNDLQPLARNSRPNHAAAAGWGHRLARDGSPGTRPSLASKACLLPSKAPCHQRGSCPDPRGWGAETEPECPGGKGVYPRPRGMVWAPRGLPYLQLRTSGPAPASGPSQRRRTFTGTQPGSASPLFTPSCTCFPHLTFREDTSPVDTLPALGLPAVRCQLSLQRAGFGPRLVAGAGSDSEGKGAEERIRGRGPGSAALVASCLFLIRLPELIRHAGGGPLCSSGRNIFF